MVLVDKFPNFVNEQMTTGHQIERYNNYFVQIWLTLLLDKIESHHSQIIIDIWVWP